MTDAAISVPVADEIASWWRVFDGRTENVNPRDLLARACSDLFRVMEIDRGVHPESNDLARQEIVDALEAMAAGAGIDADERQQIFRDHFKARTNGGQAQPDDKSSYRGQAADESGVRLQDFVAYMPAHSFIFTPTREMWTATSVNARIPPILSVDKDGAPVLNEDGEKQHIAATRLLDQNQPVEQMTWCPGRPMLIKDRLVSDGGWIKRNGVTCFNLYRPPIIEPGDPTKAGPWLDHVRKVFGDHGAHIIAWLAQRVQRPEEKINHALVLGGKPGIGKDTLLEPIKRAVGPWNFSEVSPQQIMGRFNGFLKSVVLRVNEVRDLGEVNRFQFYDHLKAYTAAPPDVLRIDEKHLREYSVFNCVGVIITTNYKADGIYLPADDRRHFVAWSNLTKDDFPDDYWNALWTWYGAGGIDHVVAYLTNLDIDDFNPKGPPAKTPAFWDIVNANRAPEDAELADVLDSLGNPKVVTLSQVIKRAAEDFAEWLKDRRNRPRIPRRFESCGYAPVRNEKRDDNLWIVNGRRQVVYALNTLTAADQIREATKLEDRQQ